jgi:hypothetical protein
MFTAQLACWHDIHVWHCLQRYHSQQSKTHTCSRLSAKVDIVSKWRSGWAPTPRLWQKGLLYRLSRCYWHNGRAPGWLSRWPGFKPDANLFLQQYLLLAMVANGRGPMSLRQPIGYHCYHTCVCTIVSFADIVRHSIFLPHFAPIDLEELYPPTKFGSIRMNIGGDRNYLVKAGGHVPTGTGCPCCSRWAPIRIDLWWIVSQRAKEI